MSRRPLKNDLLPKSLKAVLIKEVVQATLEQWPDDPSMENVEEVMNKFDWVCRVLLDLACFWEKKYTFKEPTNEYIEFAERKIKDFVSESGIIV